MKFRRKGVLLVVSAPSGTGKTTLVAELLRRRPEMRRSVSVTTRPPRPGERSGRDYRFVSPRRFQAMRRRGAFAEWARVHGHAYGTPRALLDRAVRRGYDVVLTIDVQGGLAVARRLRDVVLVLLVPPSWEELRHRLVSRGALAKRDMARRLRAAKREVRIGRKHYQYVVVNRRVGEAAGVLEAIVRAERAKVRRVEENIWKRMN